MPRVISLFGHKRGLDCKAVTGILPSREAVPLALAQAEFQNLPE